MSILCTGTFGQGDARYYVRHRFDAGVTDAAIVAFFQAIKALPAGKILVDLVSVMKSLFYIADVTTLPDSEADVQEMRYRVVLEYPTGVGTEKTAKTVEVPCVNGDSAPTAAEWAAWFTANAAALVDEYGRAPTGLINIGTPRRERKARA